MTDADKEELLAALERDLDMWDRYSLISHHGSRAAQLVWAAVLARAYLASPADAFQKIVLGLLGVFRPWAVWVFKALDLNAGIEITRPLLLCSGITFGLMLLDRLFAQTAQRAWERLDDADRAFESDGNDGR